MFKLSSIRGSVIEMRHRSAAIRRLSDSAVTPRWISDQPYCDLSLEEIHDFHALVTFYECKSLVKQAKHELHAATARNPISYLILASRMNDLNMAQQALEVGQQKGACPPANEVLDLVARVQPTWRVPLLHAMIRNGGGTTFRVRWPDPSDLPVVMSNLAAADTHKLELTTWTVRPPATPRAGATSSTLKLGDILRASQVRDENYDSDGDFWD